MFHAGTQLGGRLKLWNEGGPQRGGRALTFPRVMGEIRYLHLIVPWQIEPESTLVETLNLALEQGRCGAHPKVVENLPITSIHAPTILDVAEPEWWLVSAPRRRVATLIPRF